MKIRTKSGKLVEIFAVYWGWQEKTYFYGLPDGYGGLLAYDSSEVEVVDAVFDGRYIFQDGNLKGIYHEALIEEGLLDDLLELDPGAYSKFLKLIGR